MLLQQHSQDQICQALGLTISRQLFKRWNDFFEQTQCVIRNPDTYQSHGPLATLTAEESTFMIELVRSEPGLFLSEIRERLYDSSGTLLSVKAIHHNLVNRLSITLQKAGTLNVQKSLAAKYRFVERMLFFPADWLVFTG